MGLKLCNGYSLLLLCTLFLRACSQKKVKWFICCRIRPKNTCVDNRDTYILQLSAADIIGKC